MEQLTKTMLEKADELLLKATTELYKPEEDVVAYSVCRNAYYAIVNYLRSFLNDHGASFQETSNISELLANCRAIDQKFNDLHLAPLYHPTQSEDVWMNMDTVRNFMAMAQNTRKMVCED